MAKKKSRRSASGGRRKASRATGRKKAARKSVARRRPAAARKAPKPARKIARLPRATPKGKATTPVRKKVVARKKVAVRKKAVAQKKVIARKKAVVRLPRAIARGKVPSLNRERRIVREDDIFPTPPSSLDLNRTASAARTGRRELHEKFVEHTDTSPAITGGDIDADWESAATVGDEVPGGDNPTPDMDIVDDIGKALGVQYEDNEELKGEKKISDRDRNRWELDPASAEDYNEKK